MSCTGNPHLHTPHMDALAAAGIHFTQSYCAAPVCGPSRACLTTGRLPHEHGVLVNGMTPDPAVPNIGELFRHAGYETAWSGRWHLPDNGSNGQVHGFDILHDPQTQLGLGQLGDEPVVDAASEFIQRWHQQPFFLGVSLCNPHDICHWIMQPQTPPPDATLPPLPDNFAPDYQEVEFIRRCRARDYYGDENTYTAEWDETQWRRYLYAYYRFSEGQNAELLFDIENDPGERENLVQENEKDDVLDEHRALLHQWCAQTRDNFIFLL